MILNKELRKQIKLVILPAILLSFFLTLCTVMICSARRQMLNQVFDQVILSGTPEKIPFVKFAFYGVLPFFLQIILMFTLLITLRNKSFEKVLKGALKVIVGVLLFLTIIAFFRNNLPLQSVSGSFAPFKSKDIVQICGHLFVSNWSVTLFCIGAGVCATLAPLFIWGFINRFTNPSEGVKYYLPLALVLLPLGSLGLNKASLWMKTSWSVASVTMLAAVFMACALGVLSWALRRLDDNFVDSKEASYPQAQFSFFRAAYLLAGCLMIQRVLHTLITSQSRGQFTNYANRLKFMESYSTVVTRLTIATSILWAAVGILLLVRKGWRTATTYGCFSVLIGGVIFLSLPTLTGSVSVINQGVYTGFLAGTSSILFFPLVQILYLYLPQQGRFRSKVITEMGILYLIESVSLFVAEVPSFLFMCGLVNTIVPYVKILAVILMVLLVIIGKQLSSRNFDGDLATAR